MDSDINYIIQESLNGDKNYQEILLERLNPLIYRNIYKYYNYGDPIIQDLVQEGYVLILQALKTFDKSRGVHFLYYIKTKIIFFYKNHYKNNHTLTKEIHLTEYMDQINIKHNQIENNSCTLENVIKKEFIEELLTNINKLKLKEQDIICLYYYDNKSLKEISETLKIPYRTVIGKKKTALKKLKKLFRG
ncbi:MAG: sigma-70 family polymerase sigma factor [Sedimentibacter sp.]|jgi:RNA polymerase sporulation-specific sigma factor|nr:sigma-70 family polymerase sigma factor [Sedimentibacter sp.]